MKRRALVTGANRGIGLEMSRQLITRDWNVIASYRGPISPDLSRFASEHADECWLVQLDVSRPCSVTEAIKTCAERFTSVELLVNNAGVFPARPSDSRVALDDTRPEDGEIAFATNALGTLIVSQALLPLLRRANNPVIVGICSGYASIAANAGFPYHYAASKAAQAQYLRSMAYDLRDDGISVLIFDPGWVPTDMGGPNATQDVSESVATLVNLIEKAPHLPPGSFLDFKGDSVST